MANQPQFDFAKFLINLNDPDEDIQINAMNDLNSYLSKVETVVNVPNVYFYTNTIFSLISSKNVDLINVILRSIVFMGAKFAITAFPSIFEPVFSHAYDEQFENVPQLCAILHELFFQSVTFDEERKLALKNDVFPRIHVHLRNTKGTQLVFTIDLMTALIETLGSYFTPKEIKDVEDHIKRLIVAEDDEIAVHAAQLAKFWSQYTEKEQLNSLFATLHDLPDDRPLFLIASQLCCYTPKIVESYASEFLNLFIDTIAREEQRIQAKIEEDENFDYSSDPIYIPTMTSAVTSLSFLVPTYPELTTPLFQKVTDIAYNGICFQSTVLDDDDDENEEDNNEDDEIDESLVLPMGDDLDSGEDSWKLRRASILLLQSLIKTFPKESLEQFIAADEEGNYIHFNDIQKMIRDFDNGALKVALQALLLIAHSYKQDIPIDYLFYWYSTVAKQIAQRPDIVEQLVEVLSTLSNVISQDIPSNLPETIFKAILKQKEKIVLEPKSPKPIVKQKAKIITESSSSSILSYISVFFKTTEDITDALDGCVAILKDILLLPKSIIPTLKVISHLFTKTQAIEYNYSSLIDSIIEIIAPTNISEVLQTFAVFVITHSKDAENTKKVLENIIKSVNYEGSVKPACASITLIASSPVYEVLKNYSGKILEAFSAASQESSVDLSQTYALLWAIRVTLEKEIIQPKDCSSLLPVLLNLILSGDNKCKNQALIILQKLPGKEEALKQLKDLLVKPLPGNVLEAAAALICKCEGADAAISDLISYLTKSTMKEDLSIVIGIVGAAKKSIRDSLIQNFISSEKPSSFDIECIGQLASEFDISGNTALVDKLFALIKSEDRSTFEAAEPALGLADVILPRLLKEAKTDIPKLLNYLGSLTICAQKCVKVNKSLDKYLDEFIDVLWNSVQHIDPSVFEQTVSQALYQIYLLNNKYITSILDKAINGDEKIAPTAGRSISEIFNSSNSKAIIKENLEKVIGLLDRDLPTLCKWVLSALKGALKNEFGDPLIKICDKIIEKAAFQQNHSLTTFYGALTIQVDIGKEQRFNAIELLSALVQYSPDRIDPVKIEKIALTVIEDIAQGTECRIAALKLLEHLTESKFTLPTVLETLSNIAAALDKVNKDTQTKENAMEDAVLPLMHCIALLHLKTQKGLSADIEKLFSAYKNEKMEEILDDLTIALTIENASGVTAQLQNQALILLNKYNPEAGSIYA